MSSVRAALVTSLNTKGRCMDNRGAGPSFLGFTHKAGWILVTCENQRSKDWLVSEVPNCKPWPEANLSIMEDSELPKPWIATTLIPATDASSVSEALDTIRYQNEGLYPEHWRVLSEKVDGAGIIAAISLDEISVETLRARDFRVNIGFRKIVFRVRGANTGSASGAAAEVHTNPATAAPGSTGLGVGSAGLSTSSAPPAPGPSGLGGRSAGNQGRAVPGTSGRGGGGAGRKTGSSYNPVSSGLAGSHTGQNTSAAGRRGKAGKGPKGAHSGRGHAPSPTGGGSGGPAPVVKRAK
ncbi:cuticle collagen 13-like [Pararge aegeria]|uniref:cuticle collagen 13-like n=1 Tax=Pararge aegeria TaxID=116150 RepID=UPI0019D2409C|nr:cuticle collagen 13-like [Pararge aegeria]